MTTPTPAELRELADGLSMLGTTNNALSQRCSDALRACADVIERLRETRDDCIDTAHAVGDLHGNLGERYRGFAVRLTSLLPDNEEPK